MALWQRFDKLGLVVPPGAGPACMPAGGNGGPARGNNAVHPPPPQHTHLLYPRPYLDTFVERVNGTATAIYGKSKGPFAQMKDPHLWLTPDLDGPELQELRRDYEGAACELLILMGEFPQTREELRAGTHEMLAAYFADDWLETQPSEQAKDFSEWWLRLWERSHLLQRGYDKKWAWDAWPASLKCGGRIQKAGELYCSAVETVHTNMKLVEEHKRSGQKPSLMEYLSPRCHSGYCTPVFMLAAIFQKARLSEACYRQALPMVVAASLCVATFNDAISASREAQLGLLSLATIAGRARTIEIHNTVVDLLTEEAEQFINSAPKGTRDNRKEFADLLKSSTLGLELWQNTAVRYRADILELQQGMGIVAEHTGTETSLKEPLRELLGSKVEEYPLTTARGGVLQTV